MLKRDRQPLGTYARHYYDLFQLAGQEEVIAMLKSAEYAAIKADYDQISRTHFFEKLFSSRRYELCEERRPTVLLGCLNELAFLHELPGSFASLRVCDFFDL